MIASISWVPRGAAKAIPEMAVPEPPSAEEIEEMLKSGLLEQSRDEESEEDDEDMDVDASKKADEVANALSVANALRSEPQRVNASFDDIADGLKELDMDNYDEEEDEIEVFSSGLGNVYYPSNDMDPYLKDTNDEDSDELEDKEIKPTDSVIVCARTDDGYHALEVYVFEELDDGDTNLFVHQEVTISEFPLCTAWLDCPLNGGEKGNFVAVGSMDPAIEIWDLDVIEPVQACVVLGGQEEEVKKKKKKSKKKSAVKYKEGSHTDSVLALAWNKEYRNVLASASADRQVKIWDVSTGKCSSTMEHHTDKVQAVAWNPKSPHLILSGSFDQTIVLRDLRSNSGAKCSVTANFESLAWNPHSELSCVASLEDGTIKGIDIRVASDSSYTAPVTFTLHAHDKAVSSVSYNPSAPNLLATGSLDKTVKLWDMSNNQPSCIASRSPKLGGLFSLSFSDDRPFLLAMGGSKGKLEVWDTLIEASVSQRFGKYAVS